MNKMINNKHLFAGIDVGSLTAEALIMDEQGDILAGEIINVRPRVEWSARDVFQKALSSAGLTGDQVDLCFSTGYGRDAIPFSKKNLSEISCHGRGAHHLAPLIRTVIDVGGQDCKVIRVDADGFLEDFAMNDKCAAGTGRFLEMMAKTLGVEVSELGSLSLKSRKPLILSSQCTIFSEIEVMQLLYSRKKPKDIAAGVHASLVRRLIALIGRVGINKEVCITGGVSKNQGIVSMLEKELDVRFQPLSMDAQLVGALGAVLFARDAWRARQGSAE
jgi:predicted CoA-substrate-specific enzyme activase